MIGKVYTTYVKRIVLYIEDASLSNYVRGTRRKLTPICMYIYTAQDTRPFSPFFCIPASNGHMFIPPYLW